MVCPSEPCHAASLHAARLHAQSGCFPQMLAECDKVLAADFVDAPTLLDVGALLLDFGFLTRAQSCFQQAHRLAPQDLRALINLANVAREAGAHLEARQLYSLLVAQLPNHPVVRRNALTSLEYSPAASDPERSAHARAWGDWAIARVGGVRPRPHLAPLHGRPLRIGYVSADLCQHTVGLFVKEVIKAHTPQQVQVFAYSAGRTRDWVTDELRSACTLHDVAAMDDTTLAERIRQDRIDVLIDLSGHTAGSRLTAFALRPAPVLVSWLGYFATTGLPCMDAILLDAWHAPDGAEAQFIEPVLRLPGGRFCYQPVPWAPVDVAPPPVLHNGYITFGCFNNTAKYNDAVFTLWARVLAAVPNSRLVLKWRTFNDEGFCCSVRSAFAQRGIAPERIILRGPSFHAELLKEYAQIDIALDPFPFSGGLTSCEALWMGVPVVTWPQSRVVSRQTFALLSAIGLQELAAQDAEDYVRIAVQLATPPDTLAPLRLELRDRMRSSPLMNTANFTRQLEDVCCNLYQRIAQRAIHDGA